MPTNQELIPIYTDWVNRQLTKSGLRPIADLTTELRDYRIIANIIKIVVSDPEPSCHFSKKLSSITTNIDGLNVCLSHLEALGIEVKKVTSNDLDSGQLVSVLQLLFALSSYKQQIREKKKLLQQQKGVMPPSTSKLPSLHPTHSLASTASPSKLHAPTRLATPKVSGIASPSRLTPAASPSTERRTNSTTRTAGSGLRPPTSTTLSGNNNGSVTSGGSRASTSSSSIPSISSIPSLSSTPTKPSLITPKATPKKSQLLTPSSSARRPLPSTPQAAHSTAKNAPTEASQSKMLRLKLFGGKEKEKKDTTPQSSPALDRRKAAQPEKQSAIAKPKTAGIKSKLVPKHEKQVIFRPKSVLQPPPTISTTHSEKRCSKSSEEDSAYAGFGSTSPASSTQSSLSLRSSSSKGSREAMCDMPTKSAKNTKEHEVQDKPILAVKALSVAKRIDEVHPTDTLVKSSEDEKRSPIGSTVVGVVSPMMQRKSDVCPPSTSSGTSSSTNEEKRPPVPPRQSGPVTSSEKSSPDQVPSMALSRNPPSYTQLLKEGRIHKKGIDSSTSEDSLDSVSTTIRMKPQQQGYASAENTMHRNKTADSSGYNSEGGVAIYEKMQARMRECREHVRRYEYGDSFEDSSSLSSGISDNFDEVSTDDLSGTDHPMATAYAKGGVDYLPFRRNTNARGGRSASSSTDSRARMVAEQENLHQLLQQCRSSQRGAACGSVRSSGYASSHSNQLAVSAESDSLHHRGTLGRSPSHKEQTAAGFHSLGRKGTFSEIERMSVYEGRSAMALVSPRRVPNNMNGHDRCASGSMSARGRTEAIYAAYRDPVQLHRLADEMNSSPSRCARDPMGSQVSLASSSAYANLNDKYESEVRKLSREMDGYRQKVSQLTRRQDDWSSLIAVFDQKLTTLGRHVEQAQLMPDERSRLRVEIEHLRAMSGKVAQSNERKAMDGAGELLRQPSLESVASMASHRSSHSSSSKSSRADKSSLASFGKSKKSWIRSSFTKAFSKKKNKGEGDGCSLQLNPITGSSSRLDEIEVDELKRQLEVRDVALTDVRLDALDKAREVDVLKETINKLKSENKQLKQDMSRLLSTRSRASSRTSLAPSAMDDEPLYEMPPTSSRASCSSGSKRSSGCDSVKVTVNVDLRGRISTAVCPDNEIIIGFLATPSREMSWNDLDELIYALFDAYLLRVDPDRMLGLDCRESVIGYQMGETVRQRDADTPSKLPTDCITPTTTVRLFLRGAAQQSVDSLVLECLFPRSMLEQLIRFLLTHRRLFLCGATGIGKSNLARQLASYLAVRIGVDQDAVHDVKVPEEPCEKAAVKTEQELHSLLSGPANSVILMDNIPKQRISFISCVMSSTQLGHDAGPFVICTVNRACHLPEMQVQHNFKIFLLTYRMEGVRGFMGRFLRRRIIESEYRQSRQTSSELMGVVQFLPAVLQAVNTFIEKSNSLDVTVGPRIFLQCPLGAKESMEWFVALWNTKLIPYMERVAREGMKVLGRCGSVEDPTEAVCEQWPWLEGPSGEECLRRISIDDCSQAVKHPFNPLDTLIRLRAPAGENN